MKDYSEDDVHTPLPRFAGRLALGDRMRYKSDQHIYREEMTWIEI